MKKIIISILIFTLMFSIIGCENEKKEETTKELEKITVILDWVPNTNHTGLYTAMEKGYYKEEGLEVEIIQPSEGGTANLIASNQGEFGISYQEEVTNARTAKNPLPIKAIAAIIQHNTSGFASPKSKGIETPKDFENKKYGGWGSPAEKAMIKGLMEKENADFDTVEMVDLGALDFFQATKDHVDFTWIYYGWDGIAAEIRDYPINFIKLQEFDENLDFYTPVIISNEKYLKNNPEIAKKFLKATTKGYEFAISNPKIAVKDLLKNAPEVDEEIAKKSQIYLANEYIADAEKWGIMELERWENYSNWMYENNLIDKKLNSSEAFTNEYLPKD